MSNFQSFRSENFYTELIFYVETFSLQLHDRKNSWQRYKLEIPLNCKSSIEETKERLDLLSWSRVQLE